MHEQPRRILCELIQQYGPALHTDARRTEALLCDLCAAYPREIFVLVHAQKQRIPADLLAASRWMPQQALAAQLAHRLQENLALTENAAVWAIESWAIALAIQPAPPDRAWHWSQQQLHKLQGIRTKAKLTGKLPDWGKRLFCNFGVKLNQQLSSVLAVYHAYSGRWTKIVARLRQGAGELHRPRAGIILLIVLCALSTVGAVNQAGPAVSSAQVQAAQPQTAQAAVADQLAMVAQLAVAYPLPRPAWVNEDQLLIRSGPSTQTTAKGALTRGQQLTVLEFAPDGEWSRIAVPTEGWVNNRYLQFLSEGTPAVHTVVGVKNAYVAAESLNVRSGPGTEFAVVRSLDHGQTVVIVAAVTDGGWKQIIMPSKGWVSTEFVQVSE